MHTSAHAQRLALLLIWLAIGAPASADDQTSRTSWAIGRTPEVFAPGRATWATRVGGWVDGSYEDNNLPTSHQFLGLNHLNLFFDTRYQERVQLFLEVEYEHESDIGGFASEREYEVEQLFVRFKHSDAFALRAGKFNTPFGFWTPLHWSILMDTIQAPLHEGFRAIPEQQHGVELSGSFFGNWVDGHDTEFRYSVFSGYGGQGELLDEAGTDGWSYGSDLRATLDERHFIGVSLYHQERDLPLDRSEGNMMLYGQVVPFQDWTLRGEYLRQKRDRNTVAALSRNINIAYVKLRWDFHERMFVNYRWNWGDDDSSGVSTDHHIHTLTWGVQPRPNVRIKIEFANHLYLKSGRRDFQSWGISAGFLF